jgi:hypothetical protein
MKSEKANENSHKKKLLIKSIYNLFSDPEWRPSDTYLDEQLAHHPYYSFKDILNTQIEHNIIN